MGAYKQMSLLVGDLYTTARNLGYPESSICVLSGDIGSLQSLFPETYSNLLSCRHNRDRRSPIEYGQDLVASWLFEDYLMKELSDAGLIIEGAGADKNREVLPNTKVSSSCDCVVSYQGRQRGLEIMNDYTGWWRKKHQIDLRDQKFNKIVRTRSIFLGVSNSDNSYVLIDDISSFPSKFIQAHAPYGFKPAYQLQITEDDLMILNFKILATKIKGLILK